MLLPNSYVCVPWVLQGKKKAFEWAMAFGSCAEWNAFFFLSPTPLLRSVCLFLFYLVSLLFCFYYFCFEFKLWHPCLPQDVCHKLQSNVVTMIFFLPVPFYDLVFSFLSFFLFFPSRSGASDVKQPRYGFVLFFAALFLSGEQKKRSFCPNFPSPALLYNSVPFDALFLISFPHSRPFPSIPFLSFHVPSLHLVDFALSVTLLSCTLAFLPKTRLWPELSQQKVMLFLLFEMMCCEMSSATEMLLLWITEQKDECLCPECTELVETSLLSFSLFGIIRQCFTVTLTCTPRIRGLANR